MTKITIDTVAAMGCGQCDHFDSGWVGAMEVRPAVCRGSPDGVRLSPVLARSDEARCGLDCRWAHWAGKPAVAPRKSR
jgi:hypothetical protein